MPRNEFGQWHPDLWGKQFDVFNSNGRIVLLSGPSLSGKTHVALHKVCRHLWDTPGGQVAMFSKLLKNAKDGGTWKILKNRTIPEWVNGRIGFRYTTKDANGEPGMKVDGQTRTPYFRVTNAHGGESECLLFSLDHDDDIEAKIKEQEFSMIYFSELDKFRDRKVLSISLPRLRMSHLKYEQQQWMADTNPSDEGEDSWIYKVWYNERRMSYEEYLKYSKIHGTTPMSESAFYQFTKGLELYEFTPRENPRVDPRQLEELESAYSYDAGLFARYVEGKWIYGDGDASIHFRGFFKPAIHIKGRVDDPDEETWEKINPHPTSVELVTGWDLGDTNHAAVVLDKHMRSNRLCFSVIDELVSLHQEVSNEAFTEGFMELITALDEFQGRAFILERNWSDRSSIEKYNATGDTFPYKQVLAASGQRIFLQGTPKAAGSVRIRVRLLKQLLAQDRIKVSAHCFHVIRMLKELKKGKEELNYVIRDDNKHVFDALTYALLMECAEELDTVGQPNVGKRDSGMVQL